MSIESIMQNLPAQVSQNQANELVISTREESLEMVTVLRDYFFEGVEVNFTDEGVIALSEESLDFMATRMDREPSEESRAGIQLEAQIVHAIYCEKLNQDSTMPG
ncbi:hypothetical protein COB21_02090 [Candidatus Aerophobetes bacterium]|uniref:Uncharacterized protein n=1 Tax=Aerophobetes bacterium TaxID=2030807 RepID=A0A2A4X5P4_UNCAE|nr:MAG: hypothetical protein COB21_02090 [Candidatus Aerophobetes bacterium]